MEDPTLSLIMTVNRLLPLLLLVPVVSWVAVRLLKVYRPRHFKQIRAFLNRWGLENAELSIALLGLAVVALLSFLIR